MFHKTLLSLGCILFAGSLHATASCPAINGFWQGYYTDPEHLFDNKRFPIELYIHTQNDHFYGYTLPGGHSKYNPIFSDSQTYLWGKCQHQKLNKLFFLSKGKQCGASTKKPGYLNKNRQLILHPHYENAMIGTTFNAILKRLSPNKDKENLVRNNSLMLKFSHKNTGQAAFRLLNLRFSWYNACILIYRLKKMGLFAKCKHTSPCIHSWARGEEITNIISHCVGFLLAIAALVLLVVTASLHGSALSIICCTIFGSSLIIAYAASTLYHTSKLVAPKSFIKALDHIAIYILIAGTYTPFMLVSLGGAWGWSLFGVVWGLTLVGSILKLLYVDRYETLSTLIYVAMGLAGNHRYCPYFTRFLAALFMVAFCRRHFIYPWSNIFSDGNRPLRPYYLAFFCISR